jgi:hypothetical protein
MENGLGTHPEAKIQKTVKAKISLPSYDAIVLTRFRLMPDRTIAGKVTFKDDGGGLLQRT